MFFSKVMIFDSSLTAHKNLPLYRGCYFRKEGSYFCIVYQFLKSKRLEQKDALCLRLGVSILHKFIDRHQYATLVTFHPKGRKGRGGEERVS